MLLLLLVKLETEFKFKQLLNVLEIILIFKVHFHIDKKCTIQVKTVAFMKFGISKCARFTYFNCK